MTMTVGSRMYTARGYTLSSREKLRDHVINTKFGGDTAAYSRTRAEFLDHLDLGTLNGEQLDALDRALHANESDDEEDLIANEEEFFTPPPSGWMFRDEDRE